MKRYDVNPTGAEPSATSTDLLRQAQANNQLAWQQLVNQYSRRMYRWCRRAGMQQADAGNVVQESLEAVARKLGDFRRDRPGDTFRGWLRRITDNKIRDHFRRQGRVLDLPAGGTDAHLALAGLEENHAPNDELASDEIPVDDHAEHDQATWDTSLVDELSPNMSGMQHEIQRVRSEVSERDWTFFWRVVVDGQSAAEVGREFGVTANTVRLVKMRMLRRLRKSLADSTPSNNEP